MKKKNTQSIVSLETVRDLAHNPSKSSMEQLTHLMETTHDSDQFKMVAIAYAEALMSYYTPQNDEEEDQFTLAHLLSRNENRMLALDKIMEEAANNEREMRVSKRVHDMVLENNPDKHDDWEYEWSHDYYICIAPRAEDLTERDYLEVWIPTAEKLLAGTKYADMPEEFWELWRDDATGEEDDDDDDGEDEECDDHEHDDDGKCLF